MVRCCDVSVLKVVVHEGTVFHYILPTTFHLSYLPPPHPQWQLHPYKLCILIARSPLLISISWTHSVPALAVMGTHEL